jgi:hypothetical protein
MKERRTPIHNHLRRDAALVQLHPGRAAATARRTCAGGRRRSAAPRWRPPSGRRPRGRASRRRSSRGPRRRSGRRAARRRGGAAPGRRPRAGRPAPIGAARPGAGTCRARRSGRGGGGGTSVLRRTAGARWGAPWAVGGEGGWGRWWGGGHPCPVRRGVADVLTLHPRVSLVWPDPALSGRPRKAAAIVQILGLRFGPVVVRAVAGPCRASRGSGRLRSACRRMAGRGGAVAGGQGTGRRR